MADTEIKLLFLGLCSGDPELIRHWCANGQLPHLRGFLGESLVGEAQALPGCYVGAHWPSFISGSHPGHHGIHSWEQLRPGSYETYRCEAATYSQRPPFWDALSMAGKRLCMLDIPHSRISEDINGLQTVEWGAHDAAYGFQTSTPELKAEILERFGRHPVSGESDADRDAQALLEFRDELLDGIRRKTQLTLHYLKQEPWDLFAQVFTEAHCAGHLFWHTHDIEHPRHAEVAGICSDLLLTVYQAIDEALGEILEAVSADTTVILLANHGIGPKYGAQHLLEPILLGLDVSAQRIQVPRPPGLRDRLDPILTGAWQNLPAPLKMLLQPLRRRTVDWVTGDRRPQSLIDRAASLCFPVQNNSASGAIRVNLMGREPAGRVQPGAEYEALLDRLTNEFLALRNEETGMAIVDRVYRADEHYPGEARSQLPDLFIEWAATAPVAAVSSPTLAPVTGQYDYCRTGDHRPGGMYAARAPYLRAGDVGPIVTCLDFAPTISDFLGMPVQGLDGRTIDELLPAKAQAVAV
ncbi:MAG: alkaline phosphatase family protein [Gammaproteobacteria bacterium]